MTLKALAIAGALALTGNAAAVIYDVTGSGAGNTLTGTFDWTDIGSDGVISSPAEIGAWSFTGTPGGSMSGTGGAFLFPGNENGFGFLFIDGGNQLQILGGSYQYAIGGESKSGTYSATPQTAPPSAPEPGTLALMGLGIAAGALARRRKQ